MTPGDLYRTCRVSAHRLETLQHYEVANDVERQQAFHAGHPLPPPRQQKRDDLKLISELRKAGREIGRVHLVVKPLSEYVRYELAVYAENVAAGEKILIADKTADERLTQMNQDFAVFDGGTPEASLILFRYDATGRLDTYEHVSDRTIVKSYWTQYQRAAKLAVPLETFVLTSP